MSTADGDGANHDAVVQQTKVSTGAGRRAVGAVVGGACGCLTGACMGSLIVYSASLGVLAANGRMGASSGAVLELVQREHAPAVLAVGAAVVLGAIVGGARGRKTTKRGGSIAAAASRGLVGGLVGGSLVACGALLFAGCWYVGYVAATKMIALRGGGASE